jgi:hypothetical protein
MGKTTTTRYDVAENLRNPEEMAAYPALWINLSAKRRATKRHVAWGAADPLGRKF